jgi:hypothetical protein
MALLVRMGVLTIDEASKLNDQHVSILVEAVNYELVQHALADTRVQAQLRDKVSGMVNLKSLTS